MIPLRDENPTRARPLVTLAIIVVCCGIFFVVQPRDDPVDDARFTFETAAIPCEVVRMRGLTRTEVVETLQGLDDTACDTRPEGPTAFPDKNVFAAVLYSMFLHGDLLHLGGNMLYLWIFGNNIEDRRGRVQYAGFYLLAGVVATVAHIAIQPTSSIPVVGASGAIAGVMGAYLVMFPNAPIRSLIVLGFIVTFQDIRAKWLLGIWFVSQFFIAPGDGVAWMAHVGGFVFGVAVGFVWRARRRSAAPAPSREWWQE